MTEVVLFHHALGLTPGIHSFAERLRQAGHTVNAPNLFDGRTFARVHEGVAHAESIGFGEVMARGERAVEGLPSELVYVGFSLGVLPAQRLAQTRPGALAAVLCYSAVPVSEFGDSWPEEVPVQIHGMDNDPIFVGEGDIDFAREIVDQANDGELFLYSGEDHYFADDTLPSYDAEATALMTERILGLLARVG
jgi:dienelactone hydrolase